MNAITEKPTSKTGRLLLGSAVTALLATGATTVNAEEVSLTVEHTCPLPIIGEQPLVSEISADLPAEVTVGESTGELNINAVTTINNTARQGLYAVGGRSLEGTATAENNIALPESDQPLSVTLEIPQQPIPGESGSFTVDSSATVDPLTFDNPGQATITVGDLQLDQVVRDTNGNIANDPVGEFTSDCTLVGNMEDMVLHTFEVVPDQTQPANITVDPQSLDLGGAMAGSPLNGSITVGNDGGEALNINSVTIAGANADLFTQSNDCTTLEPGQSCSVDVNFQASEPGTYSASVEVDSTDPDAEDSPKVVDLNAEATEQPEPALELSSEEVDFGTIDLADTNSAEQTLDLTNTGEANLEINGLSIGNNPDGVFTQTNDCPSGLSPEQSCTVTATFQPTQVDDYSANLEIATNLESSPETVTLSGSAEDTSGGDDGDNGDGDNGDGDNGNGGTEPVDVTFDLEGFTNVAANDADVPLNGQIDSEINLETGDFTADLQLDPTQAQFQISQLFHKIQGRADIEFEPVGETTGSLDLETGQLTAESDLMIKIPEARISIIGFGFGSDGIRIGGGNSCQTVEPATINLSTPEGEEFDPLQGGTVTGTYVAPELENCGLLTGVLNKFFEGPGNTIELELSPRFEE
ncbi:choice-of-anchor D domain-containing protein [Vreelandella utahensis]|uniref:choice-of-anchor D domain-containing protein n=1 Tax=Vreelandella halophila TaxID=86177 RepID=UPI0015C3FA23|nr:choice-of-anchor D domain-containing protein [Halomonas utahensis]